MIKWVLLLIFGLVILFILFLSFSRPTSKYAYIFQRYILGKDHSALSLFAPSNGYYTTWHLNGRVRETTSYKNGLKNGGVREYDKNGKLIVSGKYLDGKKNGVYSEFGVGKKKHTTYKDGKRNGQHIELINGIIYNKIIYENEIAVKILILNGKVVKKDQGGNIFEEEQ